MEKNNTRTFATRILSALKRGWFHSVRRQVMLTFAIAFALLTSGFLLYLIGEQQKFFHTRSEEQAFQLATVLATNSTSWVLANDVVGLQEIIQPLSRNPDLRYAMVVSPRGEVLAHSDPAVVGHFVADAPGRALLKAAPRPTLVAETDTLVDTAVPILIKDHVIGWARIGLSRASYISHLHSMAYHGTLYLLIAVVLGSALALLVARRLTGGLYKLMRVMQLVKNGQRDLRVRMKYEDEIAALGNDFNRMLDALDESEEKFRKISMHAQDAIVIINQDGSITDWNRAAEAMFGYSAEAALGHDIHLLLTPSRFHEAARAGLEHFRRTGEGPLVGRILEFEARRSNGEEFPVELSISSVKFRDVWHAIGIVRDISARKQAEAVRRELAAIVESSREAIIGKNLDGIITSWNKGAERVYGYNAEEMIGKPVSFLAPEELRDEVMGLIGEIRQGRVVENRETIRTRKDGRPIHVALTLSPIRDTAGQLVGISTIARDITERKLAELALRHSEESLAKAQRIAHLGNWDWDIVGEHLAWSDEIYRIFGLTPQQFGATYEAFLGSVHPDDRAAVMQAVDDALEKRKPYSIDHRIVLPDGRMRHVHEQAEVTFNPAGQATRMLGTVQDITDQKQAELTLRRLNRALRTISLCNEVLVHAGDEASLLQQMCDSIVQAGGYQAAWVDFVEHDEPKSLRRVALAGASIETMPCTSWASGAADCCPTVRAVHTGQPETVQDIAASAMEPWRTMALEHGFAATIALPLKANDHVFGILTIYAGETFAFNEDEIRLIKELAADLAFGIRSLRTRGERDLAMEERQRNLDKLRENLEDAVQAIAATVEMRDLYTAGHQRRVADLASAMAREMGLSEDEVHGIHLAGIVHDLGKISVPAEILSKPSALSKLEYGMIQVHPQVGHDILSNIDFPWPIADMVLQHHEHLDGSGYPQGLKNGDILLGARIIAIADTIEAMASHRPYRPGKGIETALQEIEQGRGQLYDPAAVDACLRLFRKKGYELGNPSTQRS